MEFLHVLALSWTRLLSSLMLAGHIVLVFVGGNTNALPPLSYTLLDQDHAPIRQATPSPLLPVASSSVAVPLASQTIKTTVSPVVIAVSKPSIINTVSPTLTQPTITQAQVDEQTRAALVNILCTTQEGGYFNPISGSGVIIDSRGVILTNAHVGQYFLLRNYPIQNNVNCIVRSGSPAAPQYTAELLYLPLTWINANANQIDQSSPVGSGESDYSFLRITGTTSGAPLPSTFPALTMTLNEPSQDEPILLAAYPAEDLGGTTIQTNLYITSTIGSVGQLFAFHSTSTVDLISVGKTIVSQEGSSGGAVVQLSDGALTGIIANQTTGTSTANRDLRAITLNYIDRALTTDGQGSIATLLTGDIAQKSANFNTTIAPEETATLTAVLNKE
jgi:Trypsin-like peptidase domain